MWKYGRILQFLVANATILFAMYSVGLHSEILKLFSIYFVPNKCLTFLLKLFFSVLFQGVLGDVEVFVSSPLVDPVWWFIVLGGIIFVMAAFGCIGALRENILLLRLVSIGFCFTLIISDLGQGLIHLSSVH